MLRNRDAMIKYIIQYKNIWDYYCRTDIVIPIADHWHCGNLSSPSHPSHSQFKLSTINLQYLLRKAEGCILTRRGQGDSLNILNRNRKASIPPPPILKAP